MHPQFTPSDIDRLMNGIDRSGGDDACWPWTRSLRNGYGQLSFVQNGKRRNISTNRAIWIVTHGSIPAGMFICHKCDNPLCCNPRHLFLGTVLDNNRDKETKGRGFHGTAWNPVGETNPRAKLTESQVVEIRRRWSREKLTKVGLASEYGVSDQLVSLIIRQRCWVHLPSVADLAAMID